MKLHRCWSHASEEALANERGNDGPYFNGEKICLVDAGYGPFFQRFLIANSFLRTGLLDKFPLVRAWSRRLLTNDLIVAAVAKNFVDEYKANLVRRGAYAATLMQEPAATTWRLRGSFGTLGQNLVPGSAGSAISRSPPNTPQLLRKNGERCFVA